MDKEQAAEIRRIRSYPGCEKLKWIPCRVCTTYCPDLGFGNKHLTCIDPPVPVKRGGKKAPDPNQGSLLS